MTLALVLLAAALLGASLALTVRIVAAFGDRWLAVQRDRLALDGRRVAIEEARVKQTENGQTVPIPDDLFAIANGESEEWAKDETLALLRQWYGETRDWDKVRVKARAIVRPEGLRA